jgi:hypothetical protein
MAATAHLVGHEARAPFLSKVGDWNRILGFDGRAHGGHQRLVTCAELVARAFDEAGVPISVTPEGAEQFDLGVVSGIAASLVELLRDPSATAWRRASPVAPHRGAPAASAAKRRTPTSPATSLARRDHSVATRRAGVDWGPNLVTPCNLERSADFEPLGRLHAAAA